MIRLDVIFNGREYTFRTNDSGAYLFTGLHENRQIGCESGYQDEARMKKAIREYLRFHYEMEHYETKKFPRIKYLPWSAK
jgi:hypothetical protein